MVGGFVVGTSGVVWLGSGSNDRALTIDASLQTLDVHLPEHKPAPFKNTVGKLLRVFDLIRDGRQRLAIFVQELVIVRRLQAGLVFNPLLLGLMVNVARVQG